MEQFSADSLVFSLNYSLIHDVILFISQYNVTYEGSFITGGEFRYSETKTIGTEGCCGDGVCSATEASDGSCPNDCK